MPFRVKGDSSAVHESQGQDVVDNFKEGEHWKVVAAEVSDVSPLSFTGFVVRTKKGENMFLGSIHCICEDKTEFNVKAFSDVLSQFFKKTPDEFVALTETEKEAVYYQ